MPAGSPSDPVVTGSGDSHGTGLTPAARAMLARDSATARRSNVSSRCRRPSSGAVSDAAAAASAF